MRYAKLGTVAAGSVVMLFGATAALAEGGPYQAFHNGVGSSGSGRGASTGSASADPAGHVRTLAEAADPGPNPYGVPATYQAYTWELKYFPGRFAPGSYVATVTLSDVRGAARATWPGRADATLNVLVRCNGCRDMQSPLVEIVSSVPRLGHAVVGAGSVSATFKFNLDRSWLGLVIGAGTQSYATSGVVTTFGTTVGSGTATLNGTVTSISLRRSSRAAAEQPPEISLSREMTP